MTDSKRCSRCKSNYPLSHFSRDKSTKDGLSLQCSNCRRYYREINKEKNKIYQQIYKAQHRERLLAEKRVASRIYYQKNRQKVLDRQKSVVRPEIGQLKQILRRARKQQNGIFRVTAREIQRLRAMGCLYCGKATSGTIDHIIPLSRGGAHKIGNLVASCLTCNLQKGTKFLSEWKLQKLKMSEAG
jgi:5-methylcytosine-specific restriction endonuclease McrA